MVPNLRLRSVNDAPVRPDREVVLYWMTAARRSRYSFAFDRAVDRARELGRPLVVLEPLRVDYPHASARLHRFILDGMRDTSRRLARARVLHHVYVEPAPGAGRGLLEAWAERACVVVTDDFPTFFLPHMTEAAGRRLEVRVEAVDGNGLVPLAAAPRVFARAVDLRRFVQRQLPGILYADALPRENPLSGPTLAPPPELPRELARRWPPADLPALATGGLARLPLDHAVAPTDLEGGERAARSALAGFVDGGLGRYLDARHPDAGAESGLSPYLHFGHLSSAEVFLAVAAHEGWGPGRLGDTARGARSGWWGMSEAAEAFLDQLVVWRELGYQFARSRSDHASFEAVPDWARATLQAHRGDPRPQLYTPDDLLHARTADPLWNACQRCLVESGRVPGYLRMLWGKRVLEWTASPAEAHRILVTLNDRFALDGRDPNSYSGIGWVFGLFDRPWSQRPVYGAVRYMSSDRTRKKLRMDRWLERWGSQGAGSDSN